VPAARAGRSIGATADTYGRTAGATAGGDVLRGASAGGARTPGQLRRQRRRGGLQPEHPVGHVDLALLLLGEDPDRDPAGRAAGALRELTGEHARGVELWLVVYADTDTHRCFTNSNIAPQRMLAGADVQGGRVRKLRLKHDHDPLSGAAEGMFDGW
jgi:hypothetical protein